MTWNAARYLRFGSERLRPAIDLLARIPEQPAASILDLGCGPGTVTSLLHDRWPSAHITGVDTSPDMLAAARDLLPVATFIEADVGTWEPSAPQDLIFSNAALHWLPDHAELFTRLSRWLRPGGVLAVQMPDNFAAPSHRSIRELAASASYAGRIGSARMGAVDAPASYYALLASLGARVDLWTTEYYQHLTGKEPVLDWLIGTTLVPYLEALGDLRSQFLAELAERLRTAYPASSDGSMLFPFRRLFIVAQF